MSTTVDFTSSGTWTCPAGVTSVDVGCWGSGANGDDGSGSNHGGSGGSYGGGTLSVTPGNNYTVNVDTANNGDYSWFKSITDVWAQSGGSAGGTPSDFGPSGHNGAQGGTPFGNFGGGGAGGAGPTANGAPGDNATFSAPGNGGISTGGGNGGDGGSTLANGGGGLAPGGGGGGCPNTTGHTPGSGNRGLVRLTFTASLPTGGGFFLLRK